MVKRNNYFRVFENEKVLNRVKYISNKNNKQEGYFITITLFWDKFILNELKKESKGIIFESKNHFLKKNKKIRYLSQIGYRLLNYILFSNLLFSNFLRYININDILKLDEKDISCLKIIKQNWNLLKQHLIKEGVDDIEIFMNCIFKDISNLLKSIETIPSFEILISIEKQIEKLIKDKIRNFNEYKRAYENFNNKFEKGDICTINNILSENYHWNLYNNEKYPFLKYFYYTKYPNENILKKDLLLTGNITPYPVIYSYIKRDINKINFLKNLSLFNEFNNLLLNHYSFKITRIYAKNKILENEKIYENNKNLCDNFIKMWNKYNKPTELNIKMPLEVFLLDKENNKKFIEFYNKFIDAQNTILEPLLDEKIRIAMFNEKDKEKVYIQNINEDNIINFNLEKEFKNFNNLILINSKRNIFTLSNNTINYNNYSDYIIDYDEIEKTLTNIFLANKKLFSNEITVINYKNDNYYNIIIPKFISTKIQIEISDDDKKYICLFYEKTLNNDLKNSLLFLKELEILINVLNDNKINESSVNKIIKINKKVKDLDKLKKFFLNKNNDEFVVGKLYNILIFFEKLIFEKIKNELKNYQKELTEEEKGNINQYYNNKENEIIENNISFISKEKVCIALRRLMTRYLIKIIIIDEDKEIMESLDNIVKYLLSPDLWDYSNEYFEKIKNILKNEFISFNITLNKALNFYEHLNGEKLDLTFSNYNNENEINNNNIDNSFISYGLVNDIQGLVEDNVGFEER